MAERFDWQEAYALLERGRQALEAGEARSPEEVRHVLRKRAQAFARPAEEAPPPTEVLELLVFSVAGERYGIETVHVVEVVALRDLTPVPCTPSFVLGVVNHRGRILPVLDIRRLLEPAGQGIVEGSRAAVVDAGGMMFGIMTDAVEGIVSVGAHELAALPAALTRDHQVFFRGMTGTMVAVLNLEALARDPQIVVNEEVG